MVDILFVTCRNIYSMCGELKLIKSRSKVLLEEFGTGTDFVGYIPAYRKEQKQDDLGLGSVDITFFGGNPLNAWLKYKEFEGKVVKALKDGEYSTVIISGSFPGNIGKVIKRTKNVDLIYDCHGVWDELIEFNPNIKRRFRYRLFTAMEKKNLKYCDAAFAVSHELKKYLQSKYSWNKETYIVPCASKAKDYSVEEAEESRRKWRKEMGVADNELLFIYSGGVSPWQSIDKAYDIYLKYKKEGGKAKFLIMTPHGAGLDFPEAIIRSFPSEQVGEVLFAGDVAMLIREDFRTNHVAFPNKYLEYVLSNMHIIATPYLKDISKEIKEKNLGMIIEKSEDFSRAALDEALKTKQPFSEIMPQRKKIVEKYSFERTLVPFAERIKSKS